MKSETDRQINHRNRHKWRVFFGGTGELQHRLIFTNTILVTFLLLLIAAVAYQTWMVPFSGWDSLNWASGVLRMPPVQDFADLLAVKSPYPRHPPGFVLALHGLSTVSSKTGIGVPFLMLALLGVLAIACVNYFRRLTSEPIFALIFLQIILSTPLLENHLMIAGYADIVQAMSIAATLLSLTCFIEFRQLRDLVFCVLFGIFAFLLKASTGVYLIATLAVLPMAVLTTEKLKIGKIFIYLGFCLSVASLILIFNIGSDHRGLLYFGYNIRFETSSLKDIVDSISRAYLSNASFGILFPAFCITSFMGFELFKDIKAQRHRLIFIGAMGLCLCMVALLAIESFGARFATNGHDVGFSRYSITFFICAAAYISIAADRINLIEKGPDQNETPLLK